MFGVPDRQNFDTKAVFGDVDVHVLSRITLHGGVRYTEADLGYAACTAAYTSNSAQAFT